jgi:hypothetical protein
MEPSQKRRLAIAALLLLLAVTFFWWRKRSGSMNPPPPPPPAPTAPAPVTPPVPVPVKPTPKPVPVKPPKRVKPTKPSSFQAGQPMPHPAAPTQEAPPAPVTTPSVPKPPPISLHKELIPKNIEIVRVYYDREIVAPETTITFDINGSGFTQEFEDMIQVDAGGLDVQIKNLQLITANQIQGEMVIGSAQTTAFLYPVVKIRGVPVFRAPDPFAVVRPGEVLVIIFVSLSDDGRSGRFRVVTNLDEAMAKQFRVVPTNPGLEVSPLEFHLPFGVEGILQIGPAVPQGQYGLAAYLGQRELWKREGMIRIVRPNVGLTGFVQGVSPVEKFHRPGDTVQIYLHGSGLTPAYTTNLKASVNELDMGPASFQFVSAAQMRFSFNTPPNAALRSYGVRILDQKNTELFKKDDVFTLVPPNWISGVQLAPPPRPGQKGLLRIIGRDLSPTFISKLELQADEPGIELQNIRRLDASTAGADISISTGVAPGDYWIHLIADGKEINPPYGSLIKVERP